MQCFFHFLSFDLRENILLYGQCFLILETVVLKYTFLLNSRLSLVERKIRENERTTLGKCFPFFFLIKMYFFTVHNLA